MPILDPVLYARRDTWLGQLDLAAAHNDGAKACALLEALDADPSLSDPNATCLDAGPSGSIGPPLLVAIQDKHATLVALLAAHPRVDLNALDHLGTPALLRAAYADGPEAALMVRALLDAGADPKIRGMTGWSAGNQTTGWSVAQACIAWTREGVPVLDVLLAHGALDLNERDDAGNTLMHLALDVTPGVPEGSRPHPTVVWLLDHGAPLDEPNHADERPVDWAQRLRTDCPRTLGLVEGAVLRATSSATLLETNRRILPPHPAVRPRL